jgi:uncharacterized membrane protein
MVGHQALACRRRAVIFIRGGTVSASSIDKAVLLLCLLGLYISVYFTLLAYGRIWSGSRLVPAVFRMGGGACSAVLHHPDARLFGLPNSLVGIFYYAAIALATVAFGLRQMPAVLVGASWAVVGAGVFLVYSLYARVRVPCRLCLASHLINLLIALLMSLGPSLLEETRDAARYVLL